MKEVKKYPSYFSSCTILNFITVSYSVALKIVTFMVIPSVQQGRRKTILPGAGQNLKKVLICKKKVLKSFHFISQSFSAQKFSDN